jgi:hypothetical protein
MSNRALAPSPYRLAKSSISASNVAMSSSARIRSQVNFAEDNDRSMAPKSHQKAA